MFRRTLYTLTLVLVAMAASAQTTLSAYEYWLDGNYDQRATGSSNEQDLSLSIGLRNLSPGLHFLNFRGKDTAGQWGGVSRHAFVVTASDSLHITQYESWFDNDYDHRRTATYSDSTLAETVSLRGLKPGLHCYNLRMQGADGYWGSVHRSMFLLAAGGEKLHATRYESWFDSDYDHRETKAYDSSDSLFVETVSVQGLKPGLHCYNIRYQAADGYWSPVYRQMFLFTTKDASEIARYECWMDSDYDHRTMVEASGDSLVQTVDLSGLEEGVHFYNLRAQNSDGLWGHTCRYMIFIAEPDASAQVAAVKYWLDADTLNIREKATRGMTVDVTMDISELAKGTHTFSCYLQNILGDTTDVYHYDFEVGYVVTPVISHTGNTIHISTTTPGATIRYTQDNTRPTAGSKHYTEPFEVTRNDTIHAIAVRDGWINSEVARFVVDWFAEPQDYIPVQEQMVVVETKGAETGEGVGTVTHQHTEMTVWQSRQRVYCDTLRAMLTCCTLDTAAKTTAYRNEVLQIEDVLTDIAEALRQIGLERAALQGELDSLLTVDSLLHEQLTAAKTKDEVTQISNGLTAQQQGYEAVLARLADLQAKTDGQYARMPALTARMKTIEQGIVAGTTAISTPHYLLRAEQLQRLHRYPKLRHIDLSRADMENDALPDSVFMGLQQLVVAELPASVISVGTGLFTDCPRLATVVWHSTGIVADRRVFKGIDNPNLLLYVGSHALVRDVDIPNVVVGNVAERIVLTDGDSPAQNTNFYVPRAFHVSGDITYTHTYTQQSGYDECRGWETIALPFDVQTVTHEVQGPCVPFAAYENPKRPFWLCQLTERGFEDAAAIRAHIPYIISMPYNEAYSPYFQLKGNVTFAASDTDVPATAQQTSRRGETAFVPTFERIDASQQVYALNVGEPWNGHAEGSAFVSDLRDVRPFQGYRTTTATGVRWLGIADDLQPDTQGINETMLTPANARRYYNLQGMPVRNPGKGVFIRGGKKIINR